MTQLPKRLIYRGDVTSYLVEPIHATATTAKVKILLHLGNSPEYTLPIGAIVTIPTRKLRGTTKD